MYGGYGGFDGLYHERPPWRAFIRASAARALRSRSIFARISGVSPATLSTAADDPPSFLGPIAGTSFALLAAFGSSTGGGGGGGVGVGTARFGCGGGGGGAEVGTGGIGVEGLEGVSDTGVEIDATESDWP